MNENTMKYKGYIASINYEDESGVFVGRVLGIGDIIDFHGDSVQSLRREFRVAIDEYVKACVRMGFKPEKPRPGKLLLRLPPEVHSGLAYVAEMTGRSANQLIVDAVCETYLGKKVDARPSGVRRKRVAVGAK